jgi:transcriptional regulator with XRE-family HTH domain
MIMEIHKLPFARRMKEIRKEKGWKQIDLADKAGIDKNMISYYENEKYIPSADALIKIAVALDISIDYLLIEGIQKRPLRQDMDKVDPEIFELLAGFNTFTETEQESIKNIIKSLTTKNQVKDLITKAS